MSAAAVAAFGGKLLEEPRRRGIEIGGWRIECRHEPILTAEETEAWQKTLSSQWLPEMVFGKSCLRAQHLATGVGVQLGALEALRGWKEGKLPPVKVPAAAAWGKRSCPSTDIILDYDYTFTTPYCGSILTSSSASLSPQSSMAGGSSSSHSAQTTRTTADVSAPLASRVADISISNADVRRHGTNEGREGEGEERARVRAEGEEVMRKGEVVGDSAGEAAGAAAGVVREVQTVWPQSDAAAAAAAVDSGGGGGGGEGEGGSVEKISGRTDGREQKGSGGGGGGERGAGGGGEWEAEWVACGEGEGIDWAMLQRRDPILFSDEVVLYEDELADSGISLLTARAVSTTHPALPPSPAPTTLLLLQGRLVTGCCRFSPS
ncbi:unnamed protein product [Closterium sp. Yama58-4]|nr:unnamed protein product [Closterium sp. Yama58-4]